MNHQTEAAVRVALKDDLQSRRITIATTLLAGSFTFYGDDRSKWEEHERLDADSESLRRCQRALEVADMLLVMAVTK